MRKTRFLAGASIIAAGLLALTACNSGTPGAEGGSEGGSGDAPVYGAVATDVTIENSPTFDKIQSAGKVVVGVKEDQPGLGYLDPVTVSARASTSIPHGGSRRRWASTPPMSPRSSTRRSRRPTASRP